MRTIVAPFMLRQLVTALVVVSLLVLAGCGGGGALAPATPGGSSNVTLRVNWPATGSRLVPASAYTIDVTISGTGIATPLKRTLALGQSTMVIAVPAGTARVFTALACDINNTPIVAGSVIADLLASTSYDLTLPLLGLYEPNNLFTQAAPITLTNSLGEVVDVIDTKYNDTQDWFSFTAQPGIEYAVTLEQVQAVSNGPLTVRVYDRNGLPLAPAAAGTDTTLPAPVRITLPATTTASESVFVQVMHVLPDVTTPPLVRLFYHLKINGAAELNVNID